MLSFLLGVGTTFIVSALLGLIMGVLIRREENSRKPLYIEAVKVSDNVWRV
jgi:hypothetical protein